MGGLRAEQAFALIDETERAVELTDLGIRGLWSLDGTNDRYHLPLQLLSQGIERLLKLTYVLGILEATGRMPSSKELRAEFGHDLMKLVDAVVALADDDEDFSSRPAVADDLAFVRTDDDLRSMLEILSDFGQQGRYHNLETLLHQGSGDRGPSPEEAWQRLEAGILRRHPEWFERRGMPEFTSGWYEVLAGDITSVLQRFLRATCRMWTLGPLGDEGRRLTGTINRFLFLTDDRLGVPRHPTRDP